MQLHIVSERDVGLFSLIQQVIANIPWAVAENRVPVVHFGNGTCYWTPNGHRGGRTVWEYYFEPVVRGFPASSIPEPVQARIAVDRPSPYEVGYLIDRHAFVSNHFGDHPQLSGAALPIPYQWDDPDDTLRREAKLIIDSFIRPRAYLLQKVDDFFARHMAGHHLIGVHARGTDATSKQELRTFRQGSLVLSRYVAEIGRLLEVQPRAKIFVASDDQSSLDYLVHHGSSLARTVLLNAPRLPHTNTHCRSVLESGKRGS
jgi:hypothetical protein